MTMTVEPEFLEWMTDVVTVEERSGQSFDGSDTYSAPTTVAAFVEEKPRRVRDANGTEVMASATVYANSVSISTQARLTVNGRARRIINISIPRDETGQHHSEIFVE